MIQELKYYISKNTNPYINLATEKCLFDSVAENEMILYLWQNENTVVIGKNQNPWNECRCKELEADGGRLARRLSGGGAVFHDLGNLNFTFLCNKENYDLTRQMKVIQKACALAGIQTELTGRNDLTAAGRKFSGNAFYNANGKAYHHGTLLIHADLDKMQKYLTPPKAKLEAKGVKSVGARVINLSELAPTLTPTIMQEHMLDAFSSVYASVPEKIHSTFDVASLAEMYASWEYLYGSALPFTASAQAQFSWGNAELCLSIHAGRIEQIKLYTDAMDANLSKMLEDALGGCRFDKVSILASLSKLFPKTLTNDFMLLLEQIL